MEIPLDAQVECTDGIFGRSMYVLIDPLIDQVTHMVVKGDLSPNTEYIVPLDVVSATIDGTIKLNCTKEEVGQMDPFVQTEFVEERVPAGNLAIGGGAMYGMGSFYMPYVTPDITVQKPVEQLQIPLGELAVRRGDRVKAIDGYVGKVDEFVVSSDSGHANYLIMREGHLWGSKDVIIPLSAMDDTRENTVFLKIDKQEVESLPTFQVKRRWA